MQRKLRRGSATCREKWQTQSEWLWKHFSAVRRRRAVNCQLLIWCSPVCPAVQCSLTLCRSGRVGSASYWLRVWSWLVVGCAGRYAAAGLRHSAQRRIHFNMTLASATDSETPSSASRAAPTLSAETSRSRSLLSSTVTCCRRSTAPDRQRRHANTWVLRIVMNSFVKKVTLKN